MVKEEQRKQIKPRFYKADVVKLQAAVDSTGKFKTEIASAGGLSKEVLAKALNGLRITEAKANGICNGLNESGCKPRAAREILFPHGE